MNARRRAPQKPRKPAARPASGSLLAFLRGHRTAARLGLAVVLPLLLLGALELGLRAAGQRYPTRLFLPVPDQDVYGANRKFGWRFFPRAVARKPVAQAFAVAKGPRRCRIFVLGASAALGVPNAAFSFAQQLDVMLTARHPGVDFEVVNTSITAINSHVVRPVAAECAGYEPDLFLVYLGNNEVVGPWGIGSARGGAAPPLWAIRAGVALRTTAVGQALQAVGARLRGEDAATEEWGGMGQYTRNLVDADDPALARVHENFRRNLADICRAGTDAGARVVLSTVAVNLKDSPPFASPADSALAPTARTAWRDAFGRAAAAQDAGRPAEALPDLRTAAGLFPDHAETRYRLGRALLAAGDTAAAAPHLLAARDLDLLRFRADTARNAVIREVAAELAGRGVRLADAAAYVRDHAPGGLPGAELFYEHVHLNFAGNHLVARALLPAVEAALPPAVRAARSPDAPVPDRDACAQALAYTPWNAYNNWAQIRTMAVRYPFTAQMGHEAYLARLDARLEELRTGASRQQARRLLEQYERAHRARPDDLLLALNFAKLLTQTGNDAAAARFFDAVMARQPPAPDLMEEDLARLTGGG